MFLKLNFQIRKPCNLFNILALLRRPFVRPCGPVVAHRLLMAYTLLSYGVNCCSNTCGHMHVVIQIKEFSMNILAFLSTYQHHACQLLFLCVRNVIYNSNLLSNIKDTEFPTFLQSYLRDDIISSFQLQPCLPQEFQFKLLSLILPFLGNS